MLVGMLTLNYYMSTTFYETHDIVAVEGHGNTMELKLAGDAYSDFYRIRCISNDSMQRNREITYHFGRGLFGWQVMKGNSWEN